MRRARYIDGYNTYSGHELFNASLVAMCGEVFDDVECRCSTSNFQAITRILKENIPEGLIYKPLFVNSGTGRISLMLRYLIGAITNIWQLIIAPKNSVIIYPFNNLFCTRMLNIVNKIVGKKVVIFCHGEMEGLSDDVIKAGILSRVMVKLSRNFFLNKRIKLAENIYFSVMGSKIFENLSKILPEQFHSHFICIDHPYIFGSNIKENERNIDYQNINLGTVGGMNRVKGLDNYLSFVNNIPQKIRENVHFSITGRVFDDIKQIRLLGIDIPENHESISRELFDSRVQQLDYLLFFYPTTTYKITASGAIMDAILHRKPILSLRNDYFQYIFDKYGSFGYLCQTVEQMNETLELIVNSKQKITVDFEMLIKMMTPHAISSQLKGEFHRVGVL